MEFILFPSAQDPRSGLTGVQVPEPLILAPALAQSPPERPEGDREAAGEAHVWLPPPDRHCAASCTPKLPALSTGGGDSDTRPGLHLGHHTVRGTLLSPLISPGDRGRAGPQGRRDCRRAPSPSILTASSGLPSPPGGMAAGAGAGPGHLPILALHFPVQELLWVTVDLLCPKATGLWKPAWLTPLLGHAFWSPSICFTDKEPEKQWDYELHSEGCYEQWPTPRGPSTGKRQTPSSRPRTGRCRIRMHLAFSLSPLSFPLSLSSHLSPGARTLLVISEPTRTQQGSRRFPNLPQQPAQGAGMRLLRCVCIHISNVYLHISKC